MILCGAFYPGFLASLVQNLRVDQLTLISPSGIGVLRNSARPNSPLSDSVPSVKCFHLL